LQLKNLSKLIENQKKNVAKEKTKKEMNSSAINGSKTTKK
jgi:hypothetical protein